MLRKLKKSTFAICITFSVVGMAAEDPAKDATSYTVEFNRQYAARLNYNDRKDFDEAKRGFIAPLNHSGLVRDAKGTIVFNALNFNYSSEAKAPATVNPSLWRQVQLNAFSGLFKVADGIYQIRGQDISNLTVIEGRDAVIVIDPLMSKDVAKNAMETYYSHRPKRPIAAVIYTHSHVDHFGGVKGIVSLAEVESGKVKIIAPVGFMEEAISENVMAGNAMARRSQYSYGVNLPQNVRGNVGTGLGPAISDGEITLIAPTDLVTRDFQKMTVAGIEFEFMLTPGSEAPSEMHFYIPSKKALCTAENCVRTLHNFYTLRGAKTRDVFKWIGHLNKTLDHWGDDVEVLYAPHNIPLWGNQRINRHIENYRDAFRYIHDRTLCLINQGYKINDVGNLVHLPPALAQNWSTRGYYGSVSHNARAVYNFYLGFFDGNPANLNPFTPAEQGRRYVKAFGGDKIFEAAQAAFNQGDYRWTAELLKHILDADPANKAARALQADAFEQLGYQAESSTWRGFYLSGARELRRGKIDVKKENTSSLDSLSAMTVEMLFDFLATQLDPVKSENRSISINFRFDEKADQLSLTLKNSVLNYRKKPVANPDATIEIDRKSFCGVLLGQLKLDELVKNGKAKLSGKPNSLKNILAATKLPPADFDIVTSPNR